MERAKTLRGYRIGLLLDYTASDLAGSAKRKWEERKWEQINREGPFLRSLVYQAPREFDDFKAWWSKELEISMEDKSTLVVVDAKDDGSNVFPWKNHLKKLEEEEWERGVEGGVRFTTLDSVLSTVVTGEPLLDTWGDDIARGEGMIFHGRLFAFAEVQTHDPRLGFDYAVLKELILQAGGKVVSDDSDQHEMAHGTDQVCYIVAPGGGCEITDSKLSTMEELGIRSAFVNSTWVQTCCEVGGIVDPTSYPILYQPLPWPLQDEDLPPFKVSVSDLARPLRFAIGWWIRAMGLDCTEDLSDENTHLIWGPSVDNMLIKTFSRARELDVMTMPLDWLVNVMCRGYDKSVEQGFCYRLATCKGKDCSMKPLAFQKGVLVSDLIAYCAKEKSAPNSLIELRLQGKTILDPKVQLGSLVHGYQAEFEVKVKEQAASLDLRLE